MERKLELVTINGKQYQIDIEQAKKLNLLKEKNNRVRSWEEFKEKYINNTGYVYIEELKHTQITAVPFYIADQLTSQEAKALTALSKLLKLRRDWIGEWEPDWEHSQMKWAIYCMSNRIKCDWCTELHHALTFPTVQMGLEFLKTFRDLIEEAKILI